MQYLEVTVKTTAQGIGLTADALTAMGYDSLVLEDQTEYEKFLEENRACWDYIDEELSKRLQGLSQIKLYLENDANALSRLEAIREEMLRLGKRHPGKNMGSLTVSAAPLDEEDWENSWKKNYPPQFVGKNLCVLPYWLSQEAAEGRLAIRLDPGLTFGTGSHPSTQMCMAALEEHLTPGSRVIDLGSGSGILSLVSLRLGAETAVGVDIDPKAEGMARENAAYNGFGEDCFRAFTGDLVKDKKALEALGGDYDLVLVNIVADVILALSPVLPQVVRRGGLVICSGILDTRLEEVRAGLEAQGLTILAQKEQEDWRCLVARREE